MTGVKLHMEASGSGYSAVICDAPQLTIRVPSRYPFTRAEIDAMLPTGSGVSLDASGKSAR